MSEFEAPVPSAMEDWERIQRKREPRPSYTEAAALDTARKLQEALGGREDLPVIIPLTSAEGFYVTVIRNPGPRQKVGCLLGPYGSKEIAEGQVDTGRQLAGDADPDTAFDSFGVTRVTRAEGRELPTGRLNDRREAQRD